MKNGTPTAITVGIFTKVSSLPTSLKLDQSDVLVTHYRIVSSVLYFPIFLQKYVTVSKLYKSVISKWSNLSAFCSPPVAVALITLEVSSW